jgi:catechol 2,3-dioxygenase-like lactoylglutathione lyase family enzyme
MQDCCSDPPVRVNHVAVKTSDLARAERFYAELLGAPVLRRFVQDDGEERSVWLGEDGGPFLAVERAEQEGAPKTEGAPGWHTVAFGIDRGERAAVLERARRLGAAVLRETPWSIFVRDPDGNVVALSHWPDAVTA